MNEIDDNHTFGIERDEDFLLVYEATKNNEIKKTINFQFSKADISSDVNLRVINEVPVDINLMVVIKAKEGVKNVSSVLDMRALILNKKASMTFVPSLEIDEMNVSVDHKSTIGTPSKIWLDYLAARGLSQSDSIEILKKSFLEL